MIRVTNNKAMCIPWTVVIIGYYINLNNSYSVIKK